jgi:soluble lytic murein transglycosylase-like protein
MHVVPIGIALAATALVGLMIAGKSARAQVPVAKIAPRIVELARKWATLRGLPLEWVLATIWVESGGNPNAIGDGGISYGLMQVNTRAHAARMAAAGVTPQMLLDPDKNIEWGTLILREAALRAKGAGADPIDVATRHVYTGRSPQARDPAVIARWDDALARTQALV